MSKNSWNRTRPSYRQTRMKFLWLLSVYPGTCTMQKRTLKYTTTACFKIRNYSPFTARFTSQLWPYTTSAAPDLQLKQSEQTNQNATIQISYNARNVNINQNVTGIYMRNVAFILIHCIAKFWVPYLDINITFCKLKYVCFATQIPRVSSSSLRRKNIWVFMQ